MISGENLYKLILQVQSLNNSMGNDMQDAGECPKCHSRSLVYDGERDIIYCQNCGAIIEEEVMLDSSPPQFVERYEEATHKHMEPIDELIEGRDRRLMGSFIEEVNILAREHKLQKQVCKLAEDYFLRLIKAGRRIAPDKIRYYSVALVYLAARSLNIPISYKALIRNIEQPEKISRLINKLRSELKIETRPPDLKEFLNFVLNGLRIKDIDLTNEVVNLIQEAQNRGIVVGKDIRGVVGGAIYIVTKSFGMRVSQSKIAAICGVTEITIRNRALELAPIYRELTGREVTLRKRKEKRPKVKF